MSIHQYMKDRNKAMMMYPDTSGLDQLVKEYPEYFDDRFVKAWDWLGKVNPSAKLRTLEKMIISCEGVPSELVDRVLSSRRLENKMTAIIYDGLEETDEIQNYHYDDDKDESGLLE